MNNLLLRYATISFFKLVFLIKSYVFWFFNLCSLDGKKLLTSYGNTEQRLGLFKLLQNVL